MEKKTKKTPKEVQYVQTGLHQYSQSELIRMVNQTGTEEDFSNTYPEVTFTRKLAYNYLHDKFDMDYIGHGLIVPHGVTICALLDAYENHKFSEGDSKVMQECVGDEVNVELIRIAMTEKKKRKTMSMNTGTMKRWEDFLEEYPNKSDFLSAACDLFMKRFKEGKVKMEADWGSTKF